MFGAGNLVWELIIQNDSELIANNKKVPVEYKIYTVNKDDENWMVHIKVPIVCLYSRL